MNDINTHNPISATTTTVRRGCADPTHRKLIPRLFRLIAVLSSPDWPSIGDMALVLDVGERTVKRDIAFLRSIGLTIRRSRRQGGLHLDLPASAATDVGKALYNMTITLATAQQRQHGQPADVLKPLKAHQAKRRREEGLDTKRREAVLACVASHVVVKRATVAIECHLTPPQASRYLKQLCDDGKLARRGARCIAVYSLP